MSLESDQQSSTNQPFKTHGMIGVFARHKVAPNLLMVMMLLMGAIALFKLNIQFFPNFSLDYATVSVTWNGANAEDVERSVTEPLERVLRNVDDLDEMTSTSVTGQSAVTLSLKRGLR